MDVDCVVVTLSGDRSRCSSLMSFKGRCCGCLGRVSAIIVADVPVHRFCLTEIGDTPMASNDCWLYDYD